MNEISLPSIFKIILHRIWAVILVAVLCAGIAFSYCSMVATPVYRTSSSLLVTNGAIITNDTDSISNTDLAASIYLVDTCVDILKSPKIYQDLSGAISDKYSYKQLMSAFSISRRSDESMFIDLSFKSTSKEEAIQIVNAFAQLSSGYISDIIPSATITVMAIADSGSMVSPRTFFTTFVFAFIGAAVTCLIIVIVATMDKAIKGEEDFKENFDIPILGAVPDFENPNTKKKKSKKSYSSGGY